MCFIERFPHLHPRTRRIRRPLNSLWRHQMETFSALLALCAGNSPVTGEFPSQRPVTRSIDVFLDLRLDKQLSKLPWDWWFETLSCPLWGHCNVTDIRKLDVAAYLDTDHVRVTDITLQWRHNGHDGVSNHQPHDCLLNCLFRSKNTSKFRVTGLCEWNSPATGVFPAQGASNAENVSIWWRHNDLHIHNNRYVMTTFISKDQPGIYWD